MIFPVKTKTIQNGVAEKPHRFLKEQIQIVAFREDTGTLTGWTENVSNIACRCNTIYFLKLPNFETGAGETILKIHIASDKPN